MTGLEQIQVRLSKPDKNATKCIKCKRTIHHGDLTNCGEMCDDCYFEEWGEEIEKHPISSPLNKFG